MEVTTFEFVICQVWKDVLWQLQRLLSPEEALEALDSNVECFHQAGAIGKILLTSKVQYMGTVRHKSSQGNTTNLNISFSMENEKRAAQVGYVHLI